MGEAGIFFFTEPHERAAALLEADGEAGLCFERGRPSGVEIEAVGPEVEQGTAVGFEVGAEDAARDRGGLRAGDRPLQNEDLAAPQGELSSDRTSVNSAADNDDVLRS